MPLISPAERLDAAIEALLDARRRVGRGRDGSEGELVGTAALRGIGSYRERGSTFRAWLFRIAHNTVVNAHRTRSRRRTEPLPEDPTWAALDADPARLVTRADELHAVMRAVVSLPQDRRQVVLLRFVDGLSADEIGAVLGRSAGAVRVLQHRALRDLAKRLERY